MKWTVAVASVLGVLGFGGIPVNPAAAQARVVVPIVIQAPRAGSPPTTGTPTTVHVTTRTTSPQPGVTTSRITVTNTTGSSGTVGGATASQTTQTLTTVPTGTPSILVTVDRRLGPTGTGAPGQTRVTVNDVSQSGRVLGGPPASSLLRAAGPGQQTFIITSEAPIDAPIVILVP